MRARQANSQLSTAGKPRPPQPPRISSSATTASLWNLWTLWSAAVRSAFPACPGSSKPSTGATARVRGSRCSSRRSSSPIRVSPSPPRLAALVADEGEKLDEDPGARAYFFAPDGAPLPAGHMLRNPDYAATLRVVAADGADAFYNGPSAAKIVETVRSHPTNPGRLTLDDMAVYKVKERPAVCAPYRGHEVCGMGPPSSGAIAVGQILGLLEPYDIATLGKDDPEAWRLIGDASRLAFADRGRYVADSDFVSMPEGLLDPTYLKARSELLRRPTALGEDEAKAGEPAWQKAELRIDGVSSRNAVDLAFRHCRCGRQHRLDDDDDRKRFRRAADDGGLPAQQRAHRLFLRTRRGRREVANRVEPGKRPRSSMAPTIVLKDGKPVYALGSPGGSSIIPYVANDADCADRLEAGHAGGDLAAASRQPVRSLRSRGGTSAEALADDLEVARLQDEVKRPEFRPARRSRLRRTG